MKKKQENPTVNGTFSTVAMVRDPISNIQSFSLVTIEVKDGQVIKVMQDQSDTAEIIFSRADRFLRSTYKPIEEVIK